MLLETLLAVTPLAVETPLACVPFTPAAGEAKRPATHWVTSDDYPDDARFLGLEGTAEFTLQVDEHGCPTDCVITRSTAFESLDAETCRLLMARASFNPAVDNSGKAIAAEWRHRFVWALPDRRARSLEPWSARAEARFGADGALLSCRSSGTGDRFGVAQFCKFARAVPPDAVATARGGRTGPYAIRISGAAGFDGAMPVPGEQEGTPIAQASVQFRIDRSGKIALARPGEGEARLLYDLGLLDDLYDPPRDAKGKPGARNGTIVLVYRLSGIEPRENHGE